MPSRVRHALSPPLGRPLPSPPRSAAAGARWRGPAAAAAMSAEQVSSLCEQLVKAVTVIMDPASTQRYRLEALKVRGRGAPATRVPSRPGLVAGPWGPGGAQGAEGGGGPRLGAFSRLIAVCVCVSVCVCVRPSAVLRGVQGEVPYLRALRAEAG